MICRSGRERESRLMCRNGRESRLMCRIGRESRLMWRSGRKREQIDVQRWKKERAD